MKELMKRYYIPFLGAICGGTLAFACFFETSAKPQTIVALVIFGVCAGFILVNALYVMLRDF